MINGRLTAIHKYKDSALNDLQEALIQRNVRADNIEITTSLSPDEKNVYMESVTQEINLRLLSVQKQVLEIGGLLLSVKQILGTKGKQRFGDWIQENFPFSHRTANNYMNVYKCCAGNPEIVNKFQKTVLYQITSEKFPEELREELIDNAKGVYDFEQKELAGVLKKIADGEIDFSKDTLHEDIKSLISQQRDIQEEKRYQEELTALKTDLNKRLKTVEKLNKMGRMEPGLTPKENKVAQKYTNIEDTLKEFVSSVDNILNNLHHD